VVKPTPRANQLITLRENRSRRFDSNLKPALEAKGIDSNQFRQRFFQDMALMQNRTRGPLFELAGEVLVTGHLQRMGHGGAELRKQVRFAVADGVRVVDFLVAAIKTVFEVKSGYVLWSKPVRLQAAKDAWLLDHSPDVTQVIWLLFRGGSARALAGLQAAGIECFDLGFGGTEPVSKPTTVIRV
jgi:hypothetical protein